VRTFTVSDFERAKGSDALRLTGPGGAYSPDPDAGWHLMLAAAGG
jgi:NADPH-dependent ferric siderophore reductase